MSTAEPVEWELRPSATENPYAVIRRIVVCDAAGRPAEIWFRIVTWASRSEERELIGWCRDLDTAAEAAWDFNLAARSWQHSVAAAQTHSRPGGTPTRPAALDLLRAYRQIMASRSRTSAPG